MVYIWYISFPSKEEKSNLLALTDCMDAFFFQASRNSQVKKKCW